MTDRYMMWMKDDDDDKDEHGFMRLMMMISIPSSP